MVHLSPPWQPWQLAASNSDLPPATAVASRLEGRRGGRMVLIYAVMSLQSSSWPVKPLKLSGASVFDDADSDEPLRPACPRPLMSMRSAAAGGVDSVLTMAPTPPETPRVLFSKSEISSKMAVQLKMR